MRTDKFNTNIRDIYTNFYKNLDKNKLKIFNFVYDVKLNDETIKQIKSDPRNILYYTEIKDPVKLDLSEFDQVVRETQFKDHNKYPSYIMSEHGSIVTLGKHIDEFDCDYVGVAHYRRHIKREDVDEFVRSKNIQAILTSHKPIYPMTIYDQYMSNIKFGHDGELLNELIKGLDQRSEIYFRDHCSVFKLANICILPKFIFKLWSDGIKDVINKVYELRDVNEIINNDDLSPEQKRVLGFPVERFSSYILDLLMLCYRTNYMLTFNIDYERSYKGW